MKQSDALKTLYNWDSQGRYVYRKHDLKMIFDESKRTFDQSLARLVKSGVLECPAHGIYVFSLSRHIGMDTLGHIARNLRRGELVYESLESALSQWGVISQIPIDRVTYMTTGRSGEYKTPFGVVEFVHTKLPIERIAGHLIERSDSALPIADKRLAYLNLRSVGRNLDLIDMEELNA
jgi:hypothetical protein